MVENGACEHTAPGAARGPTLRVHSVILGKKARLEPKAALAQEQLDQAPCWRAVHRELRDRDGECDAGGGHGEPGDAAQAEVADERERAARGVDHTRPSWKPRPHVAAALLSTPLDAGCAARASAGVRQP